VSVYRFISAEKARTPVSMCCELLDVSRSGYYDWARRAPSDRALSDAWLLEQIKRVHRENRGVYGARRVHAELRLAGGIRVGRKRVERLMRHADLSGLVRRKRGRTTVRVPGVRVADDLVERRFRPAGPDVLWVADITYLRTWEGWLYLVAVQDVFSRRIVGWSMADHMRAELVTDALQMALAQRRPAPGLIWHSDQGSQGGFMWSSQRSSERSCDGREKTGCGSGRPAGDAFAGPSADRPARASAAVLGGDREGRFERGRCGGGGRVGSGWRPVVSGGWRHGDRHADRAVGAVPVVR
jgi:putative transposase